MAQKIGAFAYLECSAKLNDGVKDVFDVALQAIFSSKKKSVNHVLCIMNNKIVTLYITFNKKKHENFV